MILPGEEGVHVVHRRAEHGPAPHARHSQGLLSDRRECLILKASDGLRDGKLLLRNGVGPQLQLPHHVGQFISEGDLLTPVNGSLEFNTLLLDDLVARSRARVVIGREVESGKNAVL